MSDPGIRPAVITDDRQDDFAIDVGTLATVASESLSHEGVVATAEMGLAFVSLEEMTELNETYMGGNGPTDVLAFPIDLAETDTLPVIQPQPGDGPVAPDGGPPVLVGDVVICPSVAAKATNTGRGLADEMALLVVHGVLHLLGHDHAEPEEKAVMQAREVVLLAEFYPSGVR